MNRGIAAIIAVSSSPKSDGSAARHLTVTDRSVEVHGFMPRTRSSYDRIAWPKRSKASGHCSKMYRCSWGCRAVPYRRTCVK